jgi:D-beta-D-heptose 7-phosphate kinase/D-beta-D-heptose 1-phosphate adenosyltransferase
MNYRKTLANFKNKNILVIGDIILDHYIWGTVERISPEAPVPVVTVTKENHLLGGAGNVANNIVSLGAKASVSGIIGNDYRGRMVLDILGARGINTEGVFGTDRPTTVKTRVIAQHQQVVRVDREDPSRVDGGLHRKFSQFIKDTMKNFDALIISDYKKGVVTERLVREITRHARQYGTFVSVDPKVGNFPLYKGVSLVTPNKKEASEGAGISVTDEKTLIKAGKKLLTRLKCRAVLVTRGEEGMSLFERDKVHHIPTVARHVFDVTGAGDTVISAFTLAHVSGASLLESAIIANHAAGIVVGEVGTATATVEEILASFDH